MPTESGKPLIVISYAHEDEPERPAEGEVKWLSFVTGYLRPAIKYGAVDLWLDRVMAGGTDWEREIEQKLRACDIFILLVSRHSLSSDYVVDKEVAIIRERQAKGEAVHFYPLVLTPTPKIALDLVRDKNLRPRDGKPLSDYSIGERYRHMSEASDEIAEIAAKVASEAKSEPPTAIRSSPHSPERGSPVSSIAHVPPRPTAREEIDKNIAKIRDRTTFDRWLRSQPWQIEQAIAARVGLRVAPLIGTTPRQLAELTEAAFHAIAVARIASKYSIRASEFRDAVFHATDGIEDIVGDVNGPFERAAKAAGSAAKGHADHAAVFAAAAARTADDEDGFWAQVRVDADAFSRENVAAVADRPLWSLGPPDWAAEQWAKLKAALPKEQDWDVWIDWYEERLRGVPRDEDYDLGFASVPGEEWDKGPAAANAWIKAHLLREESPKIADPLALQAWLSEQPRETAIAIALRAALRVAPLVARIARTGLGTSQQYEIAGFASAIFRAAACTNASARYARPAHDSLDLARAVESANGSMQTALSGNVPEVVVLAISTAGTSVATAVAVPSAIASSAAATASNFAIGFRLADASLHELEANRVAWNHIALDAEAAKRIGPQALLDSPLWLRDEPRWVRPAFESLVAALPDDEDWDVWTDWYENRLRGGSRSEDRELVFATVPLGVWERGWAAANAWIKAHLPKAREPTSPADLPAPLPELDAPFAYGWTASQRVAMVTGAHNLPGYQYFSSEEDHRKALEAARVGGERLLKALRDGRYNARREYGEAIEYYLDDLPKAAGVGNILLANDQVRILHAMFLADAAMLPEGFASRLKSVIANQFALNAFYDLVQRHDEAVSAANWSRPFPIDAAKGFFGAVEDNTPRWFEREVEKGLRQVEQAEPPPAAAPSEPLFGSTSAIEPPPLPPGTPDAQESWKRQMATAANALWETFLQGRDMPVALDEWRKAAEELGTHVRPIIEFLRAQEERKA